MRGFAVTGVVLFHAFPDIVSGGFIGVDVFFVISGFLITGILLREWQERGAVDLAEFWGRRVRRILPAATLVLVCTAIYAALVPGLDSRLIGKNVLAASLFVLNWRQANEGTDYLAESETENPVLHYWSLGVEEQFYLVWPLLVFAFLYSVGNRSNFFAVLIAGLIVFSFTLGLHLIDTNPPYAFFGTPARAWQLLFGALAAYVVQVRGTTDGGVLSILALAVLIFSFLLIDGSTAYPGWLALLPTGAAVGLMVCQSRLLDLAPLRFLGRISFSLYLWHWPVLVFGKMQIGESAGSLITLILASVALAILTYACVEKPIRDAPKIASSRQRTFSLCIALVAVGGLSGFTLRKYGPDHVAIGNGRFLSGEAIKYDRAIIYDDGCLLRHADTELKSCVYGDPAGRKTAVLFGDSHAANWFPGLNKAAREHGWKLVVRAKAACAPVHAPQYREEGGLYRECEQWREAVLAELAKTKPDSIFVSSIRHKLPRTGEKRLIEQLANISYTVVLRSALMLPERPVECLRRTGNPDKCQWKLTESPTWSYPSTPAADLPKNVKLVDIEGRLCPDGVCKAISNGLVLATDRHHLTASISETLSGEFARLLQER